MAPNSKVFGFIKNITPFLVDNVPKIAKLFLSLAKNLDTLVVAATAAFAVFAASKINAITSLKNKSRSCLDKNRAVNVALANPFTALATAAGYTAEPFSMLRKTKEV